MNVTNKRPIHRYRLAVRSDVSGSFTSLEQTIALHYAYSASDRLAHLALCRVWCGGSQQRKVASCDWQLWACKAQIQSSLRCAATETCVIRSSLHRKRMGVASLCQERGRDDELREAISPTSETRRRTEVYINHVHQTMWYIGTFPCVLAVLQSTANRVL
jgi:hypothetical protein